MSSPISRLLSASIDGRVQTIRYRQDQLRKLHDLLISNRTEVIDAITVDSGHSSGEAEVEYFLALSELKANFSSLHLKESLEEEYSIARGKDAPGHRVGVGIVYIVPTTYTQFFSVISPLSAAIAAGNCVVVELPNNLLAVNALLRDWLQEILDKDTFAISEGERDKDSEPLDQCTLVLQNGNDSGRPSSAVRWISPSNSRSIAIVDRTADLGVAARALVIARFGFGGKSPHAPDLVLVNEFVLTDFLNAVVKESTQHLAEPNGFAESEKGGHSRPRHDRKDHELLDGARREGGVRVVVSGANGTVVEVKNRESTLLSRKITSPILIVHPIRSLDDAINLSNRNQDQHHTNNLLSAIIFAALPEAKYLSQFVPAHLSLINQIPVEILIGPTIPLLNSNNYYYPNTSWTLTHRYTPEMFSTPHPQYIHPPNPESALLSTILANTASLSSSSSSANRKNALHHIRIISLTPLPPSDQKPGKRINFFTQGLMTAWFVISVPAVGLIATAGVFGVRMLMLRGK